MYYRNRKQRNGKLEIENEKFKKKKKHNTVDDSK